MPRREEVVAPNRECSPSFRCQSRLRKEGLRNPLLRLLPFIRIPAHRRGMKRRRMFTRIRKWIPAFAGMTNKTPPPLVVTAPPRGCPTGCGLSLRRTISKTGQGLFQLPLEGCSCLLNPRCPRLRRHESSRPSSTACRRRRASRWRRPLSAASSAPRGG